MTKTNHPSVKLEKNHKKLNAENDDETIVELIFLGEYFNIHTMQMHPITKRFIERQSIQLRDWANQESSLYLYDYTDNQGYSPEIFYQWCDKYPELRTAHEYALRRIGARREQGAMTRKFAESTIHRTLGHYHKVWKHQTYELAKLKEDSTPETKVVVIEKFIDPTHMFDTDHTKISDKDPQEIAQAIRKATADDTPNHYNKRKNVDE